VTVDPVTLDPSDYADIDPAQFADMVKSASTDQLQALMTGDTRGKILDVIFRRFPEQFRADRAGATNSVIHWKIAGPDGGADTYEVVIADGACTVPPAATAEPHLAITIGAVDFLRLVSGTADPMTMFMTGRLAAAGDLGLAASLAQLFDLGAADDA
jgi:putative sterol carrier protein